MVLTIIIVGKKPKQNETDQAAAIPPLQTLLEKLIFMDQKKQHNLSADALPFSDHWPAILVQDWSKLIKLLR